MFGFTKQPNNQQQQTTNNKQPTTNNQHQTTNQQPTNQPTNQKTKKPTNQQTNQPTTNNCLVIIFVFRYAGVGMWPKAKLLKSYMEKHGIKKMAGGIYLMMTMCTPSKGSTMRVIPLAYVTFYTRQDDEL